MSSGAATLTVRDAFSLAQVQQVLSQLTPAQVARVVLRPPGHQPPRFPTPPPTPAVVAPLEQVVKARGLAFEVDWS